MFIVEWRTHSSYTIFDSSETRGRRSDDLSRLFPKRAAAGGAARPYKQAPLSAAFQALFVLGRPTDDAFPFKMLSDTHTPYFIILCIVCRQKLGPNDNVKGRRR